MDGGGFEPYPFVSHQTLNNCKDKNMTTAFTVWEGDGNKIEKTKISAKLLALKR